MKAQHHEDGFSLIELLITIVVLGALAAVVVASVSVFSNEAEETSCESDRHILYTAVKSYFAQNLTQVIPAADATPGGVENTLVAGGFVRSQSDFQDLDSAGHLVQVAGSPCTV